MIKKKIKMMLTQVKMHLNVQFNFSLNNETIRFFLICVTFLRLFYHIQMSH